MLNFIVHYGEFTVPFIICVILCIIYYVLVLCAFRVLSGYPEGYPEGLRLSNPSKAIAVDIGHGIGRALACMGAVGFEWLIGFDAVIDIAYVSMAKLQNLYQVVPETRRNTLLFHASLYQFQDLSPATYVYAFSGSKDFLKSLSRQIAKSLTVEIVFLISVHKTDFHEAGWFNPPDEPSVEAGGVPEGLFYKVPDCGMSGKFSVYCGIILLLTAARRERILRMTAKLVRVIF